MLVPFLYELRAVMDWMWTYTSLSLFDWLKMEDIFAQIFQLKVRAIASFTAIGEKYMTQGKRKKKNLSIEERMASKTHTESLIFELRSFCEKNQLHVPIDHAL
jgi:hypothetical protein